MTAKENNTILSVTELSVGYGPRPLLRIRDMQVLATEIVSIAGRSGAGKTTLLACLSGHIAPMAGTYFVGGVERARALRNTFVSRTLQNFPLLHWHTVEGNLSLAARVRGVKRTDFTETLATFSAEGLAHRYPSTLSGGERCRASLSQALLGDPRLLLLDEPFSGLDTVVKQVVAENLFRLARASGAGIIFVTHDLNDAVEFSDRVIVIGSRDPSTVVGEISTADPEAVERVRDLLVANQ
jgi:ABC-type nitrate/sulfonate/bicarbonate transport system ATPase subunit